MSENLKFRRLGTMLDCSRNAVMKPEAIKKWIDITADMGYNCVLLYIEDTYEVDDNPYFGHLRGRYTKQELREIDDYAASKGMEVIPCIQTLAHVNAIFHWPVYRDIRDYDDIMMAGDERVYDLVDKMFATMKESMRTNIINIGMDEAHMLGRGQYMTKNGVHDRFEILMTHLNRVSEIAKKYGFELLMWGDMFFRIASGGDYYADNVEISDTIKKMVPDNVKLVYWDYYSTYAEHYDKQIKLHASIKEDIWFAGGLWTWSGFAAHNDFSIEAMGPAMKSCVEYGVQDVFMTMWGDNGAECSKFAMLPSLYYVAEYAKGNHDMEAIKAGFEAKFGIPFDGYMLLDLLGTPNEQSKAIVNPEKYMLYSDCFMGQFDNKVSVGEAESYGVCAKKLAAWENDPTYGYLFKAQKALCEVLELKFDLGVRTREAYLNDDRETLSNLVHVYDEVLARVEKFYAAYKQQWMTENKPFGFDVQDLRLGGLMQRIKYCRVTLAEYLEGKLSSIEELEQPVLDILGCGEAGNGKHINYNNWSGTVTASVV